MCRFDEIRVWSRTPDHAKRFAELHGAIAMDLEPAVRGADVIVTATNSLEPFLKGEWLKEGAHVNAIGSPRPTWRELNDAMHNTLVVDSREAVLKESGDAQRIGNHGVQVRRRCRRGHRCGAACL